MNYRTRHAPLLALIALLLAFSALFREAGPADAASSMSLSRSQAAPGQKIVANGYGFHPQDDVVVSTDFYVQGATKRVVATTTVDANGAFSATFFVPSGTAAATYTVTARDFHGSVERRYLTILPFFYVQVGGKMATATVVANHSFFVSGAGFTAGETIRLSATFPLYNGNSTVVARSTRADGTGKFYYVLMSVPRNARRGAVGLVATGQASKKSGQGRINVVYRPSIFLEQSTIRPGTSAVVQGRGFVPYSRIRVSVTIPRNGAPTEVLIKDLNANYNGDFGTSIGLPSNVRTGQYRISAVDLARGFGASTVVTVSVRPVISTKPSSVLPGETVTVTGGGFGSYAYVTVSASFPLSGGGSKYVATTVRTSGSGGLSAQLSVPANAASGTVRITAKASNGRATASLQVQQPAPTATPVPATPLPIPAPRQRKGLGFSWISLWYHTVRVGTWDQVVMQGRPAQYLGIWAHVYFPNGAHFDYYTVTNNRGRWSKRFNIPRNAISRKSNQAVLLLQLWKGRKSVQRFTYFTLVR